MKNFWNCIMTSYKKYIFQIIFSIFFLKKILAYFFYNFLPRWVLIGYETIFEIALCVHRNKIIFNFFSIFLKKILAIFLPFPTSPYLLFVYNFVRLIKTFSEPSTELKNSNHKQSYRQKRVSFPPIKQAQIIARFTVSRK